MLTRSSKEQIDEQTSYYLLQLKSKYKLLCSVLYNIDGSYNGILVDEGNTCGRQKSISGICLVE